MIDKRLLGKVSNSFRYSRNIRDKIERDDDQISRQKSRLSQKSPDCNFSVSLMVSFTVSFMVSTHLITSPLFFIKYRPLNQTS